jgi:ribosomal protein S18 acetylase RimI-like enzyme
MEIIIRKATIKDIEQIYRVYLEMIKSENESVRKIGNYLLDIRNKRENFILASKKELLQEITEKNTIYLVAQIDEKIIGYIRGEFLEKKDPFFKPIKIGYLHALVVLKKWRGFGIASRLNSEVEKWFKKKGCSQVHLEVFEHNNAIKIYKSWGYKIFINKMSKKL